MRRAASNDALFTYVAGLEWNLIEPIVIESRDDLKSEERWRGRIEPFHHQVTNLITYCRRLPVTLLADDVGLGKTISAGLIISELAARQRLGKILIVCPKILGPQWKEELDSKFNISSEVLIGNDLVKENAEDFDAVITTYNSARLYLNQIPRDRFQMLILDEAHKLRNLYGVEKPPKVAVTFKKALEERRFPFVLMLTATPIQNRLWDLYSLIDLLSIARGHQNPFGSEGMFARKFIADDREKARKLRLEAQHEFRDVVYGYMSRVRRGDAKLYFPDRVVQMHRVMPSPAELQLIAIVAREIKTLNRLVQISILQALASSPEALSAQLQNMAQKGTIASEFAATVRDIVRAMPMAAKLRGLGALIDRLRAENPGDWRVIIFTTRRETQTSIEIFLSSLGIKVGIINGSTGAVNQNTIGKLKQSPPQINVVISTEAGSEGVNLQVANVLVNYDLPWNPMIVEQRIGRVQRLASAHKSVAIFNVMLQGTFEEYIVGRLMEKLQMASHAIGDLESLLEASGVGDDSENFEERVRRLVVAALEGKDTQEAVRLESESIEKARHELEAERDNINSLLGDGQATVGPRAPTLPSQERSMGVSDFVPAAFKYLGATVVPLSRTSFDITRDGVTERVVTEPGAGFGTLLTPQSAGFSRLVDEVVSSGLHMVEDLDQAPENEIVNTATQWVLQFNARLEGHDIKSVTLDFDGHALVRVRATVQHDSYERLVPLAYRTKTATPVRGRHALSSLPNVLQSVADVGIDPLELERTAANDDAIAEFCRFYLERRAIEVAAAGGDVRRAAKLKDEFTPRLDMSLVALKGSVRRTADTRIRYRLSDGKLYHSDVSVRPSTAELAGPEIATCGLSSTSAPLDCMETCQVTGTSALRHLLVESEFSGRRAIPSQTTRCQLSQKHALLDEVAQSSITGRWILSGLLKTCALTGAKAEPEHFGKCAFTGDTVLSVHLAVSEVSGETYRSDQSAASSASGQSGHHSEFETCEETRLPIAKAEAEVCAVSGMRVRPGVLETCGLTQQRIHPSHILTCGHSGRRGTFWLFTRSSLSDRPVLDALAIRSSSGAACLPDEAVGCAWTGRNTHPADLRTCQLTSLLVHTALLAPQGALRPLIELLDGVRHSTDHAQGWEVIGLKMSAALNGSRCRIVNATASPEGNVLALRGEVKSLLGLRTNHFGALYSLTDSAVIGRITTGKTTVRGWELKRS